MTQVKVPSAQDRFPGQAQVSQVKVSQVKGSQFEVSQVKVSQAEVLAAHELARRMPRIVLEARRVSGMLAHGLHGRRRAGPGETFWQFRPFSAGEPAMSIDWRRSARDGRLYVREREWEAAQNIHLWIDRSASMAFRSTLAEATKVERALVLGLALAEVLVTGGERVGYAGLLAPRATRRIAEHIARALEGDEKAASDDLPPGIALPPMNETLLIGDFLVPPDALAQRLGLLATHGARGHAVVIIDPVEETFPFVGQTELLDPETGQRLHLGDAAAWGEDYRRRIVLHREAVKNVFERHGFTVTQHHTDRPATEAALRVLTLIATSRSHTHAAHAGGVRG